MSSAAMWRASAALYRKNFPSLLVTFLPLAAAFLLVIAPLLTLPDEQISVGGRTLHASLLAIAFALVVVPMIAGGIAVGASTLLLTERIVGQKSSPGEAYGKVRSHLGPLVAAALASTLLSTALRQFLPPLEFFIRPLLYGPAIVAQVIALEGMDLRTSLGRTGDLLRKETLRVFMFLFAVSLGVSLLEILLPGLATLGLNAVNDTVYLIVTSILQILVVILLLPFVAVTMLVAYFDLRARKEDLSLEELAAERASAP